MNNKNRTLEGLRKSLGGRVYIYLKDTQTCKRFLQDAENEGYRFGNIKPTENSTDDIIALGHRKQLSYVGFVGRVAWQCNGGSNSEGKFHRIDYDKYVSGEDDFYYKSSPIVEKTDLVTRFHGKITVIGKNHKEAVEYLNEKLTFCKKENEEIELFDEAEEKFDALVLTDD